MGTRMFHMTTLPSDNWTVGPALDCQPHDWLPSRVFNHATGEWEDTAATFCVAPVPEELGLDHEIRAAIKEWLCAGCPGAVEHVFNEETGKWVPLTLTDITPS